MFVFFFFGGLDGKKVLSLFYTRSKEHFDLTWHTQTLSHTHTFTYHTWSTHTHAHTHAHTHTCTCTHTCTYTHKPADMQNLTHWERVMKTVSKRRIIIIIITFIIVIILFIIIIIIIILLIDTFISIFPNQQHAGMKALKPAANGCFLVCKSLHYYFHLLYRSNNNNNNNE